MNTVAKFPSFSPVLPPSPDLQAVLDVLGAGVPLTRRDLTPERVSEARQVTQTALSPATPELILSWLKSLTRFVVNAPDERTAQQQACSLAEICGDLPAGVWTPAAWRAWCRQGERGKFWPAPAELYDHLRPAADRIRRNVAAAGRIVAMAASPREEGPTRADMTPEQREAVRQKAARAAETLRRQSEEDEKIRRHGAWMPPGAEGLAGRPLAEALRRALPGLSGDLLAMTRQRVDVLERAADMADAFAAGCAEIAHI